MPPSEGTSNLHGPPPQEGSCSLDASLWAPGQGHARRKDGNAGAAFSKEKCPTGKAASCKGSPSPLPAP